MAEQVRMVLAHSDGNGQHSQGYPETMYRWDSHSPHTGSGDRAVSDNSQEVKKPLRLMQVPSDTHSIQTLTHRISQSFHGCLLVEQETHTIIYQVEDPGKNTRVTILLI